MIEFTKLFNIPVIASEQNPASLGVTADGINFQGSHMLFDKPISKTLFTMINDDVLFKLKENGIKNIILVGIEVGTFLIIILIPTDIVIIVTYMHSSNFVRSTQARF